MTDELPDYIEVNGVKYPIYSDFRTWIKFELLFQSSVSREDAFFGAVKLCFRRCEGIVFKLPDNPFDTIKALFEFYTKSSVSHTKRTNDEDGKENNCRKRIYSYEEDADYIYAAFKEQYGIDLSESNLHWWLFRALFAGINSNTKFGEIVNIRSIELKDIPDKKQRANYKCLKRIFALNDNRSEEQKEKDIADLFW